MYAPQIPAEERHLQKSYWTENSLEATVEAMMLDSQAAAIDKEERPEVSAFDLQFCSWLLDTAQCSA